MNIAKQSWDIVEKIITNIYFPCGKYLLLPFEILLQICFVVEIILSVRKFNCFD